MSGQRPAVKAGAGVEGPRAAPPCRPPPCSRPPRATAAPGAAGSSGQRVQARAGACASGAVRKGRRERSPMPHTEDTFFLKLSFPCSTWQVNTLWLSHWISVMTRELVTL